MTHDAPGTAAHEPHGRKFPPEKWDRLLTPQRQAFLDAGWVLDRAAITPGMHVADLGAGPGFFTLPLADRVGPGGVVYATDISPEMLAALKNRGVPGHVTLLHAGENTIPIPDAAVDVALLAFVLHELLHPAAFLREVQRILRRDGRLVVLEWIPQDDGMGPPIGERISETATRALLESVGYTVVDRAAANPSQYLLIATPG
ncbi:MAG TPA: methyltransferase domain-containing protein [Gemmatimonadaceae bacterium]|nr:methyltransferase domain-containing protein [Gemmatimonadaceae bacterium]